MFPFQKAEKLGEYIFNAFDTDNSGKIDFVGNV